MPRNSGRLDAPAIDGYPGAIPVPGRLALGTLRGWRGHRDHSVLAVVAPALIALTAASAAR